MSLNMIDGGSRETKKWTMLKISWTLFTIPVIYFVIIYVLINSDLSKGIIKVNHAIDY
nr:TPA_asm: hypothetical protein [Microrhabdovirus]